VIQWIRYQQALSSEAAAVHLADQVKRSVDEGAKLLIGKRADREGAFMEPTILTEFEAWHCCYHENYLAQ
jgi:succinate-semialdehyde dehydrogenase/glutarate-semialdehyde dehydrogenase